MKIVIFLGPTLPLDEARAILDARYLPPAAQGDLLSAVTTHHPDAIGLIDGVFGQDLSVWHKEILFALEAGVRVYGASSMGALRAAETAEFGMIGIGAIHDAYRSGELTGDDEVALAHGAAADGYRRASEPLVNVRATLARARAEDVVGDDELAAVLAAARSIYFVDRTFPGVLAAAQRDGLEAATAARLSLFVRERYVDQKAADARLLLATLRDLPADAPRPPRPAMEPSYLFRALYDRDRRVPQDGVDLPLSAIAEHAALHLPDFPDVAFHAANRALALAMADHLAVSITTEDAAAEARRLRGRRGLLDDAVFAAWLARNHLAEDAWDALMIEQARCRALHRSLLVARHVEGSTRLILDALRLEDRYAPVAAAAALHDRIVRARHPDFDERDASPETLEALADEHRLETSGAVDPDLDAWREDAGFLDRDDLRHALRKAKLARRAIDDAGRLLAGLFAGPPGEKLAEE